jgi:heptosyltransferase-1
MSRADLRSLTPRRLLVIKTSSLGDVLDAMPTVAGLRQRFPDAHLAWQAKPPYLPLLKCLRGVDAVVPFPASGGTWARMRGLREAARQVREGRFDLAVDVQGLFRSAWVGWRGRVPVRVGLASAGEGAALFYTHRVPVGLTAMHAVERCWLVAEALGCAGTPRPVTLEFPEAARRKALDLLGHDDGRPLVVLAPGSRRMSARWPAARFAPVADALIDRASARVAVVGDANDREAAQTIAAHAHRPIADLTGATDLPTLGALFARAALLVSVDSGPVHLAAVLGRPVVALFGPQDPRRTGPYGAGHRVITADVDCRPCFRWWCKDVRCMAAIEPEEVSAAALAVLKAPRGDTV